jgi:hypothetical protein
VGGGREVSEQDIRGLVKLAVLVLVFLGPAIWRWLSYRWEMR